MLPMLGERRIIYHKSVPIPLAPPYPSSCVAPRVPARDTHFSSPRVSESPLVGGRLGRGSQSTPPHTLYRRFSDESFCEGSVAPCLQAAARPGGHGAVGSCPHIHVQSQGLSAIFNPRQLLSEIAPCPYACLTLPYLLPRLSLIPHRPPLLGRSPLLFA